ncbi:uroporphyrinogen-III synthase [Bradyrhizobium yuanmingense]
MSILVTRPHPDNAATTDNLRTRGHAVLLAPALKLEPVAFQGESEVSYDAVLVTSANAIRAIAPQLPDLGLLVLPLFAVGEHTAAAAREAGFAEVIVAGGDAASLRDKVMQSACDKVLKKNSTLLYLAGADLSRDLGGELGAEGFRVVTQTTYRMAPVKHLPREVCEGFAAHGIEGGAALLPAQRTCVPRCGAGRRCRNFGAGDPALLPVRDRCGRAARCRRVTGSGGRNAGRNCLIRHLGACVADPFGVKVGPNPTQSNPPWYGSVRNRHDGRRQA